MKLQPTSLELFCNAVVQLQSKESKCLLLIHNKDKNVFHGMYLKSVDGI